MQQGSEGRPKDVQGTAKAEIKPGRRVAERWESLSMEIGHDPGDLFWWMVKTLRRIYGRVRH